MYKIHKNVGKATRPTKAPTLMEAKLECIKIYKNDNKKLKTYTVCWGWGSTTIFRLSNSDIK